MIVLFDFIFIDKPMFSIKTIELLVLVFVSGLFVNTIPNLNTASESRLITDKVVLDIKNLIQISVPDNVSNLDHQIFWLVLHWIVLVATYIYCSYTIIDLINTEETMTTAQNTHGLHGFKRQIYIISSLIFAGLLPNNFIIFDWYNTLYSLTIFCILVVPVLYYKSSIAMSRDGKTSKSDITRY